MFSCSSSPSRFNGLAKRFFEVPNVSEHLSALFRLTFDTIIVIFQKLERSLLSRRFGFDEKRQFCCVADVLWSTR